MRQAVIFGGLVVAAAAVALIAASRSSCRPAELGFWFEAVTFESARLGPLTSSDIDAIAATAKAEVLAAFSGLNVSVTDRPDARYRVRVVQELHDLRFRRAVSVPAQSRVLAGLAGHGAVSFSWLAAGALAHAPRHLGRAALLEAIGRGIGRAAVHEFAHIILPVAPIHDSTDVASYEYRSAARPEQYFGSMRWGTARPLLEARLGPCGPHATAVND